jgi:transposase
MAASYNEDLRRKAIAAVKRGERKTEVSQMFSISRNTLDLWLKREAETGECRAICNYQQGCRHKITDWERFRKFIEQHGGKTQAQLAALWGDGVTQQRQGCFIVIRRYLEALISRWQDSKSSSTLNERIKRPNFYF